MKKLLPHLLLALLVVGCSSINVDIEDSDKKETEEAIKKILLTLNEKFAEEIINEMDTTIHYSDDLMKKIKENSDKFINKLHDEINNGLVSFINPESFIVEVKLSVEYAKGYDSTSISMEYEVDKDENIIFKVNNKEDFDFQSTRNELIKSFAEEGLVENEWYFLDENIILFIAVKPEINIHIDKTLDMNMYKTPLSLLINEILNNANMGSNIQSLNYNEFEGRINFFSTDISKIIKDKKITPKAMALNREDVYDESWAVIIGIDDYQNESVLQYAVEDAKAVQEMLLSKFDYSKENIKVLLNEDATKNNIENSLEEITTNAGENDRILIFFSGHGMTYSYPNGGEIGYLLPVDGNEEKLYSSAIPMNDLEQISSMSKAKHMLFLVDACYSGYSTIGTKGIDVNKTPNYMEKITSRKSRQIITAGSKDEEAMEKSEWGHSAYTKNLLDALGNGYGDSNEDGYITADELGDYLREKVSIDSENLQTPQANRFTSDDGEFIFFNSSNENVDEIPQEEQDWVDNNLIKIQVISTPEVVDYFDWQRNHDFYKNVYRDELESIQDIEIFNDSILTTFKEKLLLKMNQEYFYENYKFLEYENLDVKYHNLLEGKQSSMDEILKDCECEDVWLIGLLGINDINNVIKYHYQLRDANLLGKKRFSGFFESEDQIINGIDEDFNSMALKEPLSGDIVFVEGDKVLIDFEKDANEYNLLYITVDAYRDYCFFLKNIENSDVRELNPLDERCNDDCDCNYFKDMEKAFDFMNSNPGRNNWDDLKKTYLDEYNKNKEKISIGYFDNSYWWEELNIQIVITKKNNDYYEGKIINKGYPWYDFKKNDMVKFSIN